jgi:hypothetical protein
MALECEQTVSYPRQRRFVSAAAPDVEGRLRSLSARYASGVDRRDATLFLDVFLPDATLEVHPAPDEGPAAPHRLHGHDEIARVITSISAYPFTYHLLGQSLYEIRDTTASGEVYCVAHHAGDDGSGARGARSTGAGSLYVMYIRYLDEYRRTPADSWKISVRRVLVDWTERR